MKLRKTEQHYIGVNLSTQLRELLDIPHEVVLGDIHKISTVDHVLSREEDQSTRWHQMFYSRWAGSPMQKAYVLAVLPAIARVVDPCMPLDRFAFQRIPNIRVHLPNNKAVGIFHRDGDFGHAEPEVNIWMPLTRAWGSNSVQIETDVPGQYEGWDMYPGDVLVWDGVNRRHGNHLNRTGSTRVSLDFRCAPIAGIVHREPVETINHQGNLVLGDYFATYEDLVSDVA